MYAWGGDIPLFPEGCQFLTMTLHALIHIWILGAPQKMLPHCEYFRIEWSCMHRFPRAKEI